jgi:methanogenic corrinoid protein MtbC1
MLAAELRVLAPNLAREVTEEFFRRHPEWLERYGLPGVERGVEDARFHIEFLAGAIETGNREAFPEYLRWAARVLGARNIQSHFLIENIDQVRAGLNARLAAEQASLLNDVVDTSLGAFRADRQASEPVIDAGAGVYISAALSGQRGAALNIAREALREGASVIDVYCDLLQPAQYEIGRLWETNRISVAQEHLATTVTQHVIGQLYDELPRAGAERGNVVVCGVEGELHQIGAHMLADALEAEGWNVRFLGSQLPRKDVLGFVQDHDANALALSTTMLFNIPKAAELIEDVRREHQGRIHIVVGGSAFRANPKLWQEIGADGCAPDVRRAVALFKQLDV